jgi:hypothetical protein
MAAAAAMNMSIVARRRAAASIRGLNGWLDVMTQPPEHDAIRRNRLIVESCPRVKRLERVRTAKAIPLLLNALQERPLSTRRRRRRGRRGLCLTYFGG